MRKLSCLNREVRRFNLTSVNLLLLNNVVTTICVESTENAKTNFLKVEEEPA